MGCNRRTASSVAVRCYSRGAISGTNGSGWPSRLSGSWQCTLAAHKYSDSSLGRASGAAQRVVISTSALNACILLSQKRQEQVFRPTHEILLLEIRRWAGQMRMIGNMNRRKAVGRRLRHYLISLRIIVCTVSWAYRVGRWCSNQHGHRPRLAVSRPSGGFTRRHSRCGERPALAFLNFSTISQRRVRQR